MMKNQEQRWLTAISFGLLVATVGLTPWWGTAVVAALLRLFFKISVSRITIVSFAAWVSVLAARDFTNDHGPSRVLSKLLFLENLGIEVGTPLSQWITCAIIAVIGAWLAATASLTIRQIQTLARST